jgi:hypothetical protein
VQHCASLSDVNLKDFASCPRRREVALTNRVTVETTSKRIRVAAKACARSRVSAASAQARCSALGRRWMALSSAQSREADAAQMKRRRPKL